MAAKKPTPSVFAATAAVASLADIVNAGPAGTHLPESSLSQLIADGLVETNPNDRDQAGNVAVRATAKGVASILPGAVTGQTEVAKPKFAIAVGVPMPEVTKASRGRAAGGSLYPFELLEQVGASFFVPNTEERKNSAKSLASTINTANARYAEKTGETEQVEQTVYQLAEDGTRFRDAEGKLVKTGVQTVERPKTKQTREFKVLPVEDGAQWGFPGVAGAGVWRIL